MRLRNAIEGGARREDRKAAARSLPVDAREHPAAHVGQVTVFLGPGGGVVVPGDPEEKDVQWNIVENCDADTEVAEVFPHEVAPRRAAVLAPECRHLGDAPVRPREDLRHRLGRVTGLLRAAHDLRLTDRRELRVTAPRGVLRELLSEPDERH